MKSIQALLDELQGDGHVAEASGGSVPPSAPTPDVALWDKLPVVPLDRKRIAQRRIVTVDRYDKANFTFDILRTKILKIMRHNNWTSVAITSPTPECGKTLVALNLAFSFANLRNFRTVLVDLDLRRPKLGDILGVHDDHSIGRLLTGEIPAEEAFVRYGDNIAVGANWHSIPYAAELLQSPETVGLLEDVKSRLKPDIMIFDLPPMLVNDDVLSFLPHVDCVVLVAAAEASTTSEIDICERSLRAEANFLGVVLNKCYYKFEQYGY